LQLLADQSAFLDPPAGELPATGSPDAATQQRMMDMARGYVVRIWPHLPNFFFTRTTARFDDSPQILRQGDWPVRMGMHLVGTSTRNLTYRDGQETLDQATQTAVDNSSIAAQSAHQERGMTSWANSSGNDNRPDRYRQGKGDLEHWEQTSAGLAAVYNYSVPKAVSHFEVSYCCIRQDVQRELRYGNTNRGGAPATIMDTAQANEKLFQVTPGVPRHAGHRPGSGAILRVTIERR